MADRLDLAESLIDALLADATARGSQHGVALGTLLRAGLRVRRGTLAGAEADALAALRFAQSSAQTAIAAVAAAYLALARLERGALDEATSALREVGLDGGQPPTDALYTPLLSVRGRLRLALGGPDQALLDLEACGAIRERLGSRNPLFDPWRGPAALAHRALGNQDEAHRLADEDAVAAGDWGTPRAIGATLRVRGLVGEGPEAVTLLEESVEMLSACPSGLEYAQGLVDLGAALRRSGHRSNARDALARGLDLADRHEASGLAVRARDELAALGDRPRRHRLTGVEALTGGELRVARLAAQEMGNVAIAEQLVVSRKTVEKHLGNVYDKLGVHSRAELRSHLDGVERGD